MPEFILLIIISVLIGGMFRCESERDLPPHGEAFYKKDYPEMTAALENMPYLNDISGDSYPTITITKGRSVAVSTALNLNDCLLKQQLK